MKTFRAAEWDSDAAADNTYQELFKGKKKKSKLKPHVGEIEQDKTQKRKLKKLLKKKLKDINSKGLLKVESDSQKLLKNKRKKDKRAIENVKLTLTSQVKKFKSDYDVENDITKTKTKTKKKMTKKEKQKKFENVGEKRIVEKLTDKSQIKNKLNDNTNIKKLKLLEFAQKSNHSLGKQPHEHNHNSLVQTANGQVVESLEMRKKKRMLEKLKNALEQGKIRNKPNLTLRQRMMEKLKAARFRFLNEQIYTTSSKEAQKIFKSDPDAFVAYHEGYQQQVKSWPLNPLDVIITSIKKMPKNYIVADFGCGNAKLAKSVDQQVHSFDLVAVNETVIACDMSSVPLQDQSVDVAVFCLSLMGTNLHDYLLEANRVLKIGGVLKIAEVESRFENVDTFIDGVQRFGFKKTWKDLSQNLFYFMDFKKQTNIKNKKKLPTISLLPCLYKKR